MLAEFLTKKYLTLPRYKNKERLLSVSIQMLEAWNAQNKENEGGVAFIKMSMCWSVEQN